jgi:hypothetical protein
MTNYVLAFVNERNAPEVSDQPRVEVDSWRLVQKMNGDAHLLVLMQGQALRVTSRIAHFDAVAAVLTTESGRGYRLLSEPEHRELQVGLLRENANRVGLGDAADISVDLWSIVSVASMGLLVETRRSRAPCTSIGTACDGFRLFR